MSRDAATWDDLCRAARHAWDAVPDHLRQPKAPHLSDCQLVPVFSDRRTT